MDLNEKLNLIKQVGEEIISEEELTSLLQSNAPLIAYDGFEPSGKIHIPQGLIRAINVNKMIKAGCKFKMLVANWHAWANHKYGGDLTKINLVGEYFVEVWRSCGMDLANVEFVYDSDLKHSEGYWDLVMKIATKLNLPRVIRTVEALGRSESDSLTASQIIYPLMQATDIFKLDVNICQLGMDQRKVNMLAREVAEEVGFKKPVVVSSHMLLGLLPPGDIKEGESAIDRSIRVKMSKSKPDSAIFMTDTPSEVERKIKQAWCPEGVTVENPMLEYAKYLVFAKENKFLIERKTEFGGDKEYLAFNELEKDFSEKLLHPTDLKLALVKKINEYLEPVQRHFLEDARARELKEQVDKFEITR